MTFFRGRLHMQRPPRRCLLHPQKRLNFDGQPEIDIRLIFMDAPYLTKVGGSVVYVPIRTFGFPRKRIFPPHRDPRPDINIRTYRIADASAPNDLNSVLITCIHYSSSHSSATGHVFVYSIQNKLRSRTAQTEYVCSPSYAAPAKT